MIVIGIFLLLIALSIWAYKSQNPLVGISSIAFSLLLALALLGGLGSKLTVAADIAASNQLRQAAEHVDIRQSEDIYGKVVDFNSGLISLQWYNKQWWADPFVPNEWDTIKVIPITKDKTRE